MENAVDALVMAGSVLLLIIALTVSISSFTSLKVQVAEIIETRENTDLATAEDENGNTYYLNYIESADDVRTVNSSTIISAIRRVLRESYTIYICGSDTVNTFEGSGISADAIETQIVTTSRAQTYNGTTIVGNGDDVIKIEISGSGYKYIDNDTIEKLRNVLDKHEYKEYLGIYQKATAEDVDSSNKTTYRIITYVEV